MVQHAIGSDSRDDSKRDPEAKRDHTRGDGEDERCTEPLGDLVGYRTMQLDRFSEVAVGDMAQPTDVLHVHRLIETVRNTQLFQLLLCGTRAQHHASWIAWRQPRHDKDQDGHA